jgi:hypothetical protein
MTLLYSLIGLLAYFGLVVLICRFVGFNDYSDEDDAQ